MDASLDGHRSWSQFYLAIAQNYFTQFWYSTIIMYLSAGGGTPTLKFVVIPVLLKLLTIETNERNYIHRP